MKKMIGIVMMLAGGILLVSGYFVFANQEKTLSPKEEMEGLIQAVTADGVFTEKEKVLINQAAEKHNINKATVIEQIEERLSNTEDEAETEIIDQNKKKGDDFEKFIVKKFDPEYFTIKQWAGDKYVEGVYSEKTQQPDLIVEYRHKKTVQQLSIECKWRQDYKDNIIQWSYPAQLKRYIQFQKDSGMDVYIAIGIGGKGNNPEELFLVPLTELSGYSISRDELSKYKKEVADNFFYKAKKEVLDIVPYKINKNQN